MILNNVAPIKRKNRDFKRVPALEGEYNCSWLNRVIQENNFAPVGLVMFGGTSVADFHIRVAQSHLRHDLTPSYWSMVGILTDIETIQSVPLQWQGELSEMPHYNGIQECSIHEYDDPERYPNVAFLQFTTEMELILKHAESLKWRRSLIDLPELVIRWLEYIWSVEQKGNPLASSKGLPGAVFAEAAFGMSGIELTPGLATSSSCPEAIWQAAKWWGAFYENLEKLKVSSEPESIVPRGCFFMRQPSAAVAERAYDPQEEDEGSQ